MNKKLIYIFILFFVFGLKITFSQSYISLRTTGEYNIFSMSDLKKVQTEIQSDMINSGIPASIVESFPPYFGLQLEIVLPATFINAADLNYGFLIDFSSTGGRVDYKDYSGEVKFDQVVKAFSFGVLIEFQKIKNEHLFFTYGLKVPLIIASLDNKGTTIIGDNYSENNFKFNSFSVGIEPNFNLFYAVNNFIFGVSLGYLICIPSNYTYSENSDAFLQKRNGDPVTIGTNGLRLGLKVGYNFLNE